MENLKEILEEHHNREFTISEIEKAESDIKIFAEIIFNITIKELERHQ